MYSFVLIIHELKGLSNHSNSNAARQKSAEGRFLEGKLLCEKSHEKISGEKGRRLNEGFSI